MARDSFNGKVVWITGASSGIGRSLALAFDRAGARLILSSRSREGLEAVKRSCRGDALVHVLPFDLGDLEQLPGHAATALRCFGHVDYMVHNAGVALHDRAIHTGLDVDRRIMTTNYFGPVALTKALLPSMVQRRSGCFVVVSSLSGRYGGPQLSAYAASKHALHGFFESLRAEVHPEGIRITVIIPGFIRTAIAEHALTGDGGLYGKTFQVHDRGMDPDRCAARMLQAIARRKEEALVGGAEVVSVYLKRFFPTLLSVLVRSHPIRLRNQLLYWMSFGTRGSRT